MSEHPIDFALAISNIKNVFCISKIELAGIIRASLRVVGYWIAKEIIPSAHHLMRIIVLDDVARYCAERQIYFERHHLDVKLKHGMTLLQALRHHCSNPARLRGCVDEAAEACGLYGADNFDYFASAE